MNQSPHVQTRCLEPLSSSGFGKSQTSTSPSRTSAVGYRWDAAMRADGTSPSQYANGNEREDFAESWLAYTEAREVSPERLAALQQAYPNRFPIIEQLYNGAQQGGAE